MYINYSSVVLIMIKLRGYYHIICFRDSSISKYSVNIVFSPLRKVIFNMQKHTKVSDMTF